MSSVLGLDEDFWSRENFLCILDLSQAALKLILQPYLAGGFHTEWELLKLQFNFISISFQDR